MAFRRSPVRSRSGPPSFHFPLNRLQVVERPCGYGGSNEVAAVECHSLRKEQLLEPLPVRPRPQDSHRTKPRSGKFGCRCGAPPPGHATPGTLHTGYSLAMSTNVSIDVDERTADVLRVRAAELGLTVPQLVAELATLESEPREADADELAELDRRYANATGGSRVPHEQVVQWLRTWGTPGFRPWPGQ